MSPSAPVVEAARTMRDAQVGALLVSDGAQFVGIISESDLVRRVLAVGGDSRAVRVSEVMTAPIITIEIDRSAHDASDLMAERGIRHLAVMVDDFDSAYQELRTRGVHFLTEPYVNQGNRLVFFSDADGNLLHLIHREKPLP